MDHHFRSMNRFLPRAIALLVALLIPSGLHAADPLRVFIRAGAKTHGPNQHDHPRFLGDWTRLLGERGLKVSGSKEFPTATELDATDVVIIDAADGLAAQRQKPNSHLSESCCS